MSRSHACLKVEDGRIVELSATVPQRWNRTATANAGLDVIHQVLGDGIFGGDSLATRVEVAGRSIGTVRGIAAVPLRGAAPSYSRLSLSARDGASAIVLPGALLPQVASDSAHILRAEVDARSALAVASVALAGRAAMGEIGRFRRLRLRTMLHCDGEPMLAENGVLTGVEMVAGAAGSLGDAAAYISLVAGGDWAPAEPGWWSPYLDTAGVIAGVSALGPGALALRGAGVSLGHVCRWPPLAHRPDRRSRLPDHSRKAIPRERG